MLTMNVFDDKIPTKPNKINPKNIIPKEQPTTKKDIIKRKAQEMLHVLAVHAFRAIPVSFQQEADIHYMIQNMIYLT